MLNMVFLVSTIKNIALYWVSTFLNHEGIASMSQSLLFMKKGSDSIVVAHKWIRVCCLILSVNVCPPSLCLLSNIPNCKLSRNVLHYKMNLEVNEPCNLHSAQYLKKKKFSAGGLSDHEYERGLVLEFERTRLRPLGSNGLTWKLPFHLFCWLAAVHP